MGLRTLHGLVHVCTCKVYTYHYSLVPPFREYRGEYIGNKYLQKKYIEHSIEKEALLQELAEAVEANDIKQLLQVYAEGVDLSAPLPGYSEDITALHLAVELEDLTSLHMVDFLLGNGYVHKYMLTCMYLHYSSRLWMGLNTV